MTDQIRESYDAMAELYTAVNVGDIDRDTPDRAWLAQFADLAALGLGPVADLGCGPGFVTNHLSELGLSMLGYDLSPALVAEARRLFPDLPFEVGDFTALGLADGSLSGIVSRYSLIHTAPADLEGVFVEFSRLLEPGAPLLLSFFAAGSASTHGSPFDHKVVTAYELFPAAIVSHLENAGFDSIEVGTRPPLEGERAMDHGTVLARRLRN